MYNELSGNGYNYNNTILGNYNKLYNNSCYCVTIGDGNVASGNYAVAIGNAVSALHNKEALIGYGNTYLKVTSAGLYKSINGVETIIGDGPSAVRIVQNTTIPGGQFVDWNTINLSSAKIPVGKTFVGSMTIDYIGRGETSVNQCEFQVPGNEAKINFNCNYMTPIIPVYVDNTTGTSAYEMWFSIRGNFTGTSPAVRIIGTLI